ncbi:hypothetical protein AB1N83_013854 [Pleurotus pulmonarius]
MSNASPPCNLHAFLDLSHAPSVLSTSSSPTNSSLSPSPIKSKPRGKSHSSATVPPKCASTKAQTINITTLNVTYGDHYGGAIHNGCVGGRHNKYYSEPCDQYVGPLSPPPPSPPFLFTAESATVVFGVRDWDRLTDNG